MENNLVFIIAIYKRHDLTKIVLDYYRLMSVKYGFKVIIAGSEGYASEELAKGFTYIETPNHPLTFKNNLMLQKSKELNPSAVVLIGSDDLICEKLIIKYIELSKKDIDFVYQPNNIYFYKKQTKEWFHLEGENFGAGRFFPRKVLDKTNFNGWKKAKDKGCDAENSEFLRRKGIEIKQLDTSDYLLIDIKYKENITNPNILNTMTRKKAKIESPELDLVIEQVNELPEVNESDKIINRTPEDEYCNFKYNEKALYFDVNKIYKVKVKKAKQLEKQGWGVICE